MKNKGRLDKTLVYLVSTLAITLWGMSYIWTDKLIALGIPIKWKDSSNKEERYPNFPAAGPLRTIHIFYFRDLRTEGNRFSNNQRNGNRNHSYLLHCRRTVFL